MLRILSKKPQTCQAVSPKRKRWLTLSTLPPLQQTHLEAKCTLFLWQMESTGTAELMIFQQKIDILGGVKEFQKLVSQETTGLESLIAL